MLGLIEGEILCEGDTDGLFEGDILGLKLCDGETEGLTDGLTDGLIDGLIEGLML
jgi:hypothetical protein